MNKIINKAGWALMFISLILAISARIQGFELTDGQILIEYWGRYLTAFLMFAVGFFAISIKSDKE